jgi:pimeloyl-ACP methyl ester carboxylesterase
MPVEVFLPRVDMDMETAKISRWYVEEGAKVEKGSPIFEIETDKAAMEIEAPASGVVHGITGPVGQEIPIGAIVARIYAPGETPDKAAPAPAAAPASAEPVAAKPPAAAPAAAPVERPMETAVPASPASPDAAVPASGDGLAATPLARRLARMHGVELSAVRGSGPRGRIQSADILKQIEAKPLPRTAETTPTALRPPAIASGAAGQAALNHTWLRAGEGVPAVLIHGFGSDVASWRPLVASLQISTPVLALDLPGHGKSQLDGAPSLERFVGLVEDTLSALGIERFHAVGHSLGGAVATMLAARGRFDCRSLLLIASAGLGPDINGAFLHGFVRARSEAALTPWLKLLVNEGSALAPGLASAILQQRQTDGFADGQERIAASLFPDGTQCISVRDLLDGLVLPVKLVFGREDLVIPARHAQGLPGTVALHLFERVGHMPHFERREAVARLWMELLRSAN